jgi:hypothetical protein
MREEDAIAEFDGGYFIRICFEGLKEATNIATHNLLVE